MVVDLERQSLAAEYIASVLEATHQPTSETHGSEVISLTGRKEQMTNLETMRERCRERAEQITEKIRGMHSRTCSTWETWTEKNVPLMEGGRADVTFEGCQEHSVRCAA